MAEDDEKQRRIGFVGGDVISEGVGDINKSIPPLRVRRTGFRVGDDDAADDDHFLSSPGADEDDNFRSSDPRRQLFPPLLLPIDETGLMIDVASSS